MTDIFDRQMTPKWQNYALWGVQGLLALPFLAAGGQKVASTPQMLTMFDQIGAGQGFRLLTGLLEILAAVLILIPRTVVWGAGLILCIMIVAVYTHLVLIGGSALPALVLFWLATVVAWGRKPA